MGNLWHTVFWEKHYQHMNVYLVTRNSGKLRAANEVFKGGLVRLLPVDTDYPEIQADTNLEIARYTGLQAAKDLNAPVIREDHGLYLKGLGGVPGPYVRFFEQHVPNGQLLSLLERAHDRSGYFEVATVLAFPNGETEGFVFQVPFTIAYEERGLLQSGWNQLIVLDGETRTLAEYPEEERLHIWNQNYLKIRQYLEKP